MHTISIIANLNIFVINVYVSTFEQYSASYLKMFQMKDVRFE